MAKNKLIFDDSATARRLVIGGLRRAGAPLADFQAADGAAEVLAGPAIAPFDLLLSLVSIRPTDELRFFEAATGEVTTPGVTTTGHVTEYLARRTPAGGVEGRAPDPPGTDQPLQQLDPPSSQP